MSKNVTLIGYGILIWLLPFLTSFLTVNFRESNRPLFESIMPVVLTAIVLLFSTFYFLKIEHEFIKAGIVAGIVWFIISLILDLGLFMPESPMKMMLSDYMMDIGLTYLIILFIPIAHGYIIDKKK